MKNAFCILVALVTLLPQTLASQETKIKGFTEPYRSVDVAAPEMGTLSNIHVTEGQDVSEGLILANLSEEVLQASLAIASESKDAKGRLNSSIAELKMEEERYKKLMGLFQRKHASQTELDRTKAHLEIAKAQVLSVQEELRIKELEMKRIKAQLEQRRLRSPIDGIVSEIKKDVGEFVSANDPVVVKIVQLDPLLVVFSVPQKTVETLTANQDIDVQIESGGQVSGTIEFICPTADAQSGTVRVKVKIRNSNNMIKSGQTCFLDVR